MKKLNVMSLCNGMSVGEMALEELNIEVGNYYSSEIKKSAIKAVDSLFPSTIQVGDMTKWREWDVDWSSIDLLLSGFPCQPWSPAGKKKGDKDPRGALVHVLIDIWNHINLQRCIAGKEPVKFMFENVNMKKELLDYINELFGVKPILIDAARLSAQNRKRYYWTNIGKVDQPEDSGVLLADILENDLDNFKVINVNDNKRVLGITENDRGYRPHRGDRSKSGLGELGRILKMSASKSDTITASHAPKIAINSDVNNLKCREATARECCRLQSLSEKTIDILIDSGLSDQQIKNLVGDGWNLNVIVHIFKGLRAKG